MRPATAEAIAEERRRARRLRVVVDLAAALIEQSDLDGRQAAEVVRHARRHALELFPGKEEVFDLVIAPRFARILTRRYGTAHPEKVLRFRRPGGR